MSSSGGPPISLEETVIGAALSSSMLSLLLMGIYSVVYFGTLYIYISRKPSRSWIVLGTITMLYVVYVLQIAVEWFLLRRALVDDGQTQASAFGAALSSPGWNTLLNDICNLFLSAFADGLLIWRCFNVWDRSFRAIALSSLLLLSEISVYLALIIIACVQKLNPSQSAAMTLDHLFSAALFTTLASTLVTTLLISYRIYSVWRQDGLKSRKSFKNILEILTQSAAAYALVSLLYAIEIAIPIGSANIAKIFPLEGYTDVIFSFTAGVAPTVMVARVALATDAAIDRTSTTRISGLQFQAQSTSAHGGAASRTDTIHVISSA